MHFPPYFLEIAALIFFGVSGLIAWLTRWHIALVPFAACALLFLIQTLLHLLDQGTISLFEEQGPLLFYAYLSLLGLIPAFLGASLTRLFRSWRET